MTLGNYLGCYYVGLNARRTESELGSFIWFFLRVKIPIAPATLDSESSNAVCSQLYHLPLSQPRPQAIPPTFVVAARIRRVPGHASREAQRGGFVARTWSNWVERPVRGVVGRGLDEGGESRHGAAAHRTQSPVQQAARRRALNVKTTWGMEHGEANLQHRGAVITRTGDTDARRAATSGVVGQRDSEEWESSGGAEVKAWEQIQTPTISNKVGDQLPGAR
ncbi:hypothetical protein B0H14DRAFT_2612072 [Mycena olivaceomarginata]|nr:hypothetical protein B0H14DRAFT_2612072 [Mycena olivaceomarginata]